MLKIAYLISQYPAVSHTFILREILFLREMGMKIEVASINSPSFSSQTLPIEEEESLRTYYVKKTGIIRIFYLIFLAMLCHPVGFINGFASSLKLFCKNYNKMFGIFYFVEAVLVGFWMKNLGISHLHVHFANPASNVGLIVTKIFPFTFSITIHGPDEFYDVSLNHLNEKIKGSLFLCCIGYFARSQLMKLSPASEWLKFKIAPLGVDSDIYVPRRVLKTSAAFEILSVGRLVPAKGYHILIDAIELLVLQKQNIRLSLVGDGPERGVLEEKVKTCGLMPYITFTGTLNQNEVYKMYEKSDLFILPSFAEGIPVSLMEAMSMEIPCIASNINGIPELIRDGVDGFLTIPSNERELAESVLTLIDNPDLRLKIGRAGRERVLEKYQYKCNTAKLSEIFISYLQKQEL